MNLREIILRPVTASEEARFRALLDAHHYLGSLPKIGHTLWYVATWRGQWQALLSIGAAAWNCAARDRWIGWDFRYQYDRLHLIANNTRFLILPEHHTANLASRILSLCERRVSRDWTERFGHPVSFTYQGEAEVDPNIDKTIQKASKSYMYLVVLKKEDKEQKVPLVLTFGSDGSTNQLITYKYLIDQIEQGEKKK